jgi:hypothetical protein
MLGVEPRQSLQIVLGEPKLFGAKVKGIQVEQAVMAHKGLEPGKTSANKQK